MWDVPPLGDDPAVWSVCGPGVGLPLDGSEPDEWLTLLVSGVELRGVALSPEPCVEPLESTRD
ncbi:hypothetical protein [Saccharopolyspora kobensis]|uniref:hypothetical protein n=1 Tax=Saccharopolyspora kobensis TaxID=146035 RepID=UPI0033238457